MQILFNACKKQIINPQVPWKVSDKLWVIELSYFRLSHYGEICIDIEVQFKAKFFELD